MTTRPASETALTPLARHPAGTRPGAQGEGVLCREGVMAPDRARRSPVMRRRVSGADVKMVKVVKVVKVVNV